jgi:hypothetical protein
MFQGKQNIHMYKTETRPLSLTLYQNQLKVDQDLNIRVGTLEQWQREWLNK